MEKEGKELVISEKEINNNIRFFLNLGYAVKLLGRGLSIILIVIAIISFIANLVGVIQGNQEASFNNSISLIGIAALYFLFTVIAEAFIKWFGYMLYTNKNKK